MKNIIIIGGGPAGLQAACSANYKYRFEKDVNITLIEKNDRPARKLMITGKGRCNVTNNCNIDTLISNVASNGKFLYSAFSGFLPQDVMAFFESLKVPLKTERGNRVFPVSDKAVDIVDALVNTAKKGGTKIIKGNVSEILTKNGCITGVMLQSGEKLSADSVLLATGGKSYPLTGSTGDGYTIAEKLGHTVKKINPSLVPLTIYEGFCTKIAGLSLKNVTLSLYNNSKKKPVFSQLGEMLFTHTGISGPLVLTASSYIKDLTKNKYTAVIDLKPGLTYEQLDLRILRDFSEEPNKDFQNSLNKLLPRSIIPVIISLSSVNSNLKVNQITKQQRMDICKAIKSLTLTITGTAPIEEAIITRGGINVKEINPATMESKIIKGLFFAGEIIDVDAYTGGFNLQIAFSTGFLAGSNL